MVGLPWWVQWLRLHTSTVGGVGLIPGWETKIPHGVAKKRERERERRERERCNDGILYSYYKE